MIGHRDANDMHSIKPLYYALSWVGLPTPNCACGYHHMIVASYYISCDGSRVHTGYCMHNYAMAAPPILWNWLALLHISFVSGPAL